MVKPNPPTGGFETTRQPQASYIEVPQPAGPSVVKDMTMGNDRHQILVSTTGSPVRARRISAGNRASQFAGSVSDESFQLYFKMQATD
ncbi:hypothetical protein RAB80_009078 [Fusarium oxysporum f. sp. vasinfectum]|nr:hypothetical protein RAB80_009078 [Fusarium oxysporum f. sp. vasinfectum]KAK2684990.1 hypothetical protein QWA68_016716 [Fusarium oxysporum]KAK2930531.1 hypothetical protein FoTM2_008041 [Fusarium oxysporum f. sp. vasinfectum]